MQRRDEFGLNVPPLRIRRGNQFLQPAPNLVLREGDIVSAIASLSDHRELQKTVGNEVLDHEQLNYQVTALGGCPRIKSLLRTSQIEPC